MDPTHPTWSLWEEVVMGTLLLLASTSLHGLGMYLVHDRFDRLWPRYRHKHLQRQIFFSSIVLLILVTHLAEMLLWGLTLAVVGAIPIFRDAYYYAAVTYTTLGYNADMLPQSWRILAPMIAMAGFFAFGWTTGVLVNVVGRMHQDAPPAK